MKFSRLKNSGDPLLDDQTMEGLHQDDRLDLEWLFDFIVESDLSGEK